MVRLSGTSLQRPVHASTGIYCAAHPPLRRQACWKPKLFPSSQARHLCWSTLADRLSFYSQDGLSRNFSLQHCDPRACEWWPGKEWLPGSAGCGEARGLLSGRIPRASRWDMEAVNLSHFSHWYFKKWSRARHGLTTSENDIIHPIVRHTTFELRNEALTACAPCSTLSYLTRELRPFHSTLSIRFALCLIPF